MASEKKTKVKAPDLVEYGAVIYCDGAARPNPGVGGWGIHGYTYDKTPPKKGMGLKYKLTERGYVIKSEENKNVVEVTPVKFYDWFGGFTGMVANNVAEIVAANKAFELAAKYDIKDITIITDSETTVNACTSWIENWKKNKWYKSNGQPVANVDYLKSIDEAMTNAKNNGTNYRVQWIKGHSNHIGNDKADENATAAVMYSYANVAHPELSSSPAEGYWLKDVTQPELLFHQCLFFQANDDINSNEFYTSTATKDLELIGKKSFSCNYAYVYLKTVPKEILAIKERQAQVCQGDDDTIMLSLKRLYNPATMMLFNTHKNMAFYCTSKREKSLKGLNNEPVTKHLNPPLISHRVFDAVAHLKTISSVYREDKSFNTTDVTDCFYELNEKSKLIIKPSIPIGVEKVEVDILVNDKNQKLTIFMGVDVPSRNSLKRLEDANPKLSILTQVQGCSGSYKHYFLIECDYGHCLCSAVYSNTKFIL
jgi:ribonuclease HI